MNTYILFFVLGFFAFVAGSKEEFCMEMNKLSVNCGGKPNLCENLQNTNNYDEIMTTKCVGKCMLEAMGVLDGEKINLEVWTKSHEVTCEKSRLKEINAITEKCAGPEGPGPDLWSNKCEAVPQILRCIYKKRSEAKIKPCT